jgi:hypothetical protein
VSIICTAALWAPASAFIILPGRSPCANERSDYSKWYRRRTPVADRAKVRLGPKDAVQHTAVDAGHTARFVRKHRYDGGPLVVGKQVMKKMSLLATPLAVRK